MSTYSLRARFVFPVDRPPIENGVVTIDGERIIAVSGSEVATAATYDLGDVALLPGLVNAHAHLEFSDLSRPLGAPGMRLADWIRLVIAERGRADVSARVAIARGMRECLACGVTTIGEIATAGAAAYGNNAAPDLCWFAEVIGFSRARADSALTAVTERLDAMEAGSRRERRSDRLVQFGISPHAPYTVSPALLGKLIELARARNLPVAMHLAESVDELELLATGAGLFQELLAGRSMWDVDAIPRGSRPLDYLRQLAEAPHALVIHGNYLDAEERAFIALHADRMSLVYCPRTHAYFGHPPYPLADLLAIGVRVALGTDSRASNPDLNLINELRLVARVHPTVAPQAILRMATSSGAEALQRADRVGSLTPGKLANLVAIPLPATASGDSNDQLAAMFQCDNEPSAVWLRGRRL